MTPLLRNARSYDIRQSPARRRVAPSSQRLAQQEGVLGVPGHSPTPPGSRSKKCQRVQ
jgi:hypothetical protein